VRPERLLFSCYRAGQRLLRRLRGEPHRPLRIAGLMPVRDYSDATSAFAALRELSDVVIVLDDNSSRPFPFRAECDELVRLDNRESWNDQANRTLLLYRAFVHGCDWALFMDDDLAFSHDFQTRSDAERLVAELAARRRDVCRFVVRDLWGSIRHYRNDGVWGQKSIAVLRRNWFADDAITLRDPRLRLHTPAFPANLRARQALDRRHVAYHTGCMTPAERTARVAKYRREDPDRRFQRDYAYMLDESGIELVEVPDQDLRVLEKRVGGAR